MSSDARTGLVNSSHFTENGLSVADDVLGLIEKTPLVRLARLFPKARAMELAFFKAGGTLLAGTDPTGGGGVIPGFADQRQIELLVENGLTPLEAIKVGTMNGATFLGREKTIGSVAQGKQADLMIVAGNPAANIQDIRNVEIVFKQGIGYDPAKLIASVKGKVGLF